MPRSYFSQLTKAERSKLYSVPSAMRESMARKIMQRRRSQVSRVAAQKAAQIVSKALQTARAQQANPTQRPAMWTVPRSPDPAQPVAPLPGSTVYTAPPGSASAMSYDEPEEYADEGEAEELSGVRRVVSPVKVRVFSHNGARHIAARFAFVAEGFNGDRPLWASVLIRLEDGSDAEVGAWADDLKEWWRDRAKPRIKEAIAAVIRSPLALLAAGVSLVLGGVGTVVASLYLGSRVGLMIGQGMPYGDRVATEADKARSLANQLNTTITKGAIK